MADLFEQVDDLGMLLGFKSRGLGYRPQCRQQCSPVTLQLVYLRHVANEVSGLDQLVTKFAVCQALLLVTLPLSIAILATGIVLGAFCAPDASRALGSELSTSITSMARADPRRDLNRTVR